jgi:L-amino acid N-acyltransferase YncA
MLMSELSDTRRMRIEDASSVASVHVESWRSTYRGIVDQDMLDSMSVKQSTAEWRGRIISLDSQSGLWVTPGEGDVVGFANFGLARDVDATSSTVELMALYVEPTAWSSGAGAALMFRVLHEMRNLAFDEATLWVLIENERGRRFYERQGWVSDGDVQQTRLDDLILGEVRYRISLR